MRFLLPYIFIIGSTSFAHVRETFAPDLWDPLLETSPIQTLSRPADAGPATSVYFALRAAAVLSGQKLTIPSGQVLVALRDSLTPGGVEAVDLVRKVREVFARYLPEVKVTIRAGAIEMLGDDSHHFGIERISAIDLVDLTPGPRRLILFWNAFYDRDERQLPMSNLQIVRSVRDDCLRLLDPGNVYGSIKVRMTGVIFLNGASVPTFEYVGPNRPLHAVYNLPTGYIKIDF